MLISLHIKIIKMIYAIVIITVILFSWIAFEIKNAPLLDENQLPVN